MTSGLRGLTFQSPTRFVFGFGVSARLADEVRALGCRRPLVVTKQSMVDRGDVAPALRSLEEGGVPFVLYGGILPDAPIGLVDDAVELLKASGCDLVIGLGGGSAMDIAKCVAVAATNDSAGARHARPRPRAASRPADDRRVHHARRRRRHRLRGRSADRRADARARRRRQPVPPRRRRRQRPRAHADDDARGDGGHLRGHARHRNRVPDGQAGEPAGRPLQREHPADLRRLPAGRRRRRHGPRGPVQPGARGQHGRVGVHELVHRRRARRLLRRRRRLRAHPRPLHGRHPAGRHALQSPGEPGRPFAASPRSSAGPRAGSRTRPPARSPSMRSRASSTASASPTVFATMACGATRSPRWRTSRGIRSTTSSSPTRAPSAGRTSSRSSPMRTESPAVIVGSRNGHIRTAHRAATACTVPETRRRDDRDAAPATTNVGTRPCQILISVYHSL